MLGHRVHNGTAVPDQIKVAHNFPRSFFECCPKRCNSNDANSRFEIAAGELRATLSGNYPHALHRTRRRGMTPVRADYTRKGALHQLGSIAPPPNWCNTRLSGVTPLSNKPQCGPTRVERSRSSATTCIRIGNEHPDSLVTYPDAHNLSACAQPIRISPGRGHRRGHEACQGTHHAPPVWRAPAGSDACSPTKVACNSIG